MKTRQAIKSQYHASLEMLRRAIAGCPDSIWDSSDYKNPFWHLAYHALFYTHFYLSPSQDDFEPWEKHKGEYTSLSGSSDFGRVIYAKGELLEYLALCRQQVEAQVDALDFQAGSGFHWLPFDKLELQLYNLRHLQQHTGELCERLGASGEIEIDWVGMGPG